MTLMRDEIAEQPDVVAALAADAAPFRAAVSKARERGVRFVLYAARGTSDNAAVYGKYLATILAGLPAGLAVPSAATLYGSAMDLRDCLVIGISQSGETPDVANYVIRAREAGAFTLAITNEGTSRLAIAADAVLPTRAGAERAIAATKTYTSQLAALALFWGEWTSNRNLVELMQGPVPQAMRAAEELEEQIAEIAARCRRASRLLVSGRGYNYATAFETALKVDETCYVPALAFSAADLRHGPIALLEPGFPVLLFVMAGAAHRSMLDLDRDIQARGVDTIVITDTAGDFSRRAGIVPLPTGLPEPLSPLTAIVPGQLFALHTSLARGLDPDNPRGLSKITRES